MAFAPGQPPDQETVYRAKGDPPGFGPLAQACNIVEQPCYLGAGKIRVKQQSGFCPECFFMAGFFQFFTQLSAAPVLPDNCLVHRLAAVAIPQNKCFALVGNANGGDVTCADFRSANSLLAGGNNARPNFFRVMLDPAGFWKILGKLLLPDTDNVLALVEDNCPR